MADQKKVALVTGASSGMGRDFAIALAKEGFIVYGAARRLEKMDDLKSFGVRPLKMDITKTEDVEVVVSSIKERHGNIDILINNAGFGLYGSVEEVSIEDARYQFEVNLFGLARLTQLVIPVMRENKFGKIINISSMGGKIYTPLGAWYHATKHAIEGWSDCLRIELAKFGIDVVVIEPGGIETEFGDVLSEKLDKISGNGPYAYIVDGFKKMEEQGMELSKPSVITNLILKAVRAKKPKTRYVAGKLAKPLLFIRKWFGDRVYDKMVMSMIK